MRAIGIDVGGTFTDLALWDDDRGALAVFKLPSVSHDPALGILDGLRTLIAREGVLPGELTFIAHGTTVATNALLEGKGARTGLLTTRGFRDLLEIARQKRPHLYDLQADKPPPLVPRFLRREVRERLAWDGTTVEKLSLDDVKDALDALQAEDVEALAVCFLYSFVDPTHERLVAAEIRARFPEAFVSLSSEVSPGVPRVRAALHHGGQRLPGSRSSAAICSASATTFDDSASDTRPTSTSRTAASSR